MRWLHQRRLVGAGLVAWVISKQRVEYSVSEDSRHRSHVGLRIAKLDACGLRPIASNDFYGQRVGMRNEKRSDFGFALSQPVSSQWSLHWVKQGGWEERDAWLEQFRWWQ